MRFFIKNFSILVIVVHLTSCPNPNKPNPNQARPYKALPHNPYPEGTYEHFTHDFDYPQTYKIWRNYEVLESTNPYNSRVIIDLTKQRALLMKGNKVAADYPVATGKQDYETPKGNYKILEKEEKEKRSNVYGKIYDASGRIINNEADIKEDEIPEGGRFEGASMLYWMRLTWDGIGMHKGYVPREPASHGCIRIHGSAAKLVFEKVRVGTPVSITP